jgi:hypothetical protein
LPGPAKGRTPLADAGALRFNGPRQATGGHIVSSDNDDQKGGGFKNIIIGVLAGAAGIIVIKLLIKWVNGEI